VFERHPIVDDRLPGAIYKNGAEISRRETFGSSPQAAEIANFSTPELNVNAEAVD
jgi:hypothetical protein